MYLLKEMPMHYIDDFAVGDKGGDEIKSEKDIKSEKPSDQGSNAGFEARGIKREAPGIKQEGKKAKLS